jgi:tRNA A-37 threonylcarbamoyl transferase component Bud32
MITLPEHNTSGGAFGTYYKLSPSVGIKVLKTRYPSIKKAVAGRAYKAATKEVELLSLAKESGVVPIVYGVTIVRDGSKYAVGILMQHLGDKTLDKLQGKFTEAYDTVNDALLDIGIEHGDLHEQNIMYHRGKFYAIDFTPNFVDAS